MTQDLHALPPDSLRAVLRNVFTSTTYDWDEQANPFAFVADLLGNILDWLENVRELHPAV